MSDAPEDLQMLIVVKTCTKAVLWIDQRLFESRMHGSALGRSPSLRTYGVKINKDTIVFEYIFILCYVIEPSSCVCAAS